MLRRITLNLLLVLLSTWGVSAFARGAEGPSAVWLKARPALLRVGGNDREQDGLVGPVRRVRTETAKLVSKEGKMVEGPRTVLETATYDIKGAKVDTAYFLAAGGSLTGKEVYKYDEKGNITEMSLFKEDGTLLSKEIYSYEFDAVGNWTKMTTSVAVIEGGKLTFEPTEVTYRIIAYYMEESTVNKLSPVASANPNVAAQPAASQPPPPNPSASAQVKTPSVQPPAAQMKDAQTGAAGQASKPAANNAGASSPAASSRVASSPVESKKPAGVAPPELSALGGAKMYAVSNPSPVNASSASETNAPQVKVEGEAPVRPAPKGVPLKPVSGGVLNGKALSLPQPFYTDVAKRARVTGVVTVEVVIDVTGKVISAHATSGPQLLYQAAEKAAAQARFSPTFLSSQPVKIVGTINYNFALER